MSNLFKLTPALWSPPGVLANQEDLKRASLTVLVDGTHEAALDAQLHRQVLSRGVTYTPNVELRWPGREAMTLEGVFTHKPSELTSAELTINNVFQTPIVIKGKHTTMALIQYKYVLPVLEITV